MTDKKTGKSKRSSRLLAFLLVGFLIIFAGSGAMFAKELLQREKEKSAYEQMNNELQQAVEQATEQKQDEDTNAGELVLEHYAKLKEQNKDFIGWISIEGTPLSYPVVHTPDDTEYYLRRAFDGSYAVSGTPFLGEGCDVNSTNVLIYGHRMNDDTMFTTLLDYAEKEFWETHREIRFDTVDKLQTYEVFAAFYIEIPAEENPDAFRWYNYSGNISGDNFADYVSRVKAHSYYDTEISVTEGDKLITLTTCAYNNETHRFVVVAKLKQ